MKRIVIMPIMTLAALLIETRYRFFGLGLNLTVLMTYVVGMRWGHAQGIVYGAGMGLVIDSLSLGFIGPSLAGKAVAGYIASFVNRGLFTWAPVFGFFAAAAVTMVDGFISYGALWAFTSKLPDAEYAIVAISAQAALNGACGFFLAPPNET